MIYWENRLKEDKMSISRTLITGPQKVKTNIGELSKTPPLPW